MIGEIKLEMLKMSRFLDYFEVSFKDGSVVKMSRNHLINLMFNDDIDCSDVLNFNKIK